MVKFLPPPPRDSRRRGQKKKNPFSTYDVYFPIMGASRSLLHLRAGAQPLLKSWGDQGLDSTVPIPGACAPRPATGRAVDVCGRGAPPPAVGIRGINPGKFFLKTQMLNPAFLWLLRSLVGFLGRVYPSKQQACQGLNQFQNFNFLLRLRSWLSEPKTINGTYETILAVKFLAFWKLRPRSWRTSVFLVPQPKSLVEPVSASHYRCWAYVSEALSDVQSKAAIEDCYAGFHKWDPTFWATIFTQKGITRQREIKENRTHICKYGRAAPICMYNRLRLVAWHSGRTLVFGRRTFLILRSTCSWLMTTYVGEPSAMDQPTRPTQPFIPSGSIDE